MSNIATRLTRLEAQRPSGAAEARAHVFIWTSEKDDAALAEISRRVAAEGRELMVIRLVPPEPRHGQS